ncbi:biopolymer transporter ExbD [candidate division KSB1 bacterium]|nr:biopolymer transporter ExbD [candidate division KSB1 bacterium]
MAFKRPKRHKDQIELVSLIDMIFILLVFFLVTSYVIRMPLQEHTIYIPTPANELGRAQILIQLIDESTVLWLDESASGRVEAIEGEYGYLSPAGLRRRIIDDLISENTIPFSELDIRLSRLKERAESDPHQRFFLVIRSPDFMPYFRIVEIISQLSDSQFRNIKYGCVGGTLEEIRNCQRVTTVYERDHAGRRRKNIRFDF